MKTFLAKILIFLQSLTILTIILLSFYFLARIIVFSFASFTLGERVFGIILLVAEGFIAIHSLAFLLGIIRLSKKGINEVDVSKNALPSVAVVVAARHEPKEILDKTLLTLRMLDYPNKKIYLLDDSSDEKFKNEAKEVCQKHGAIIFSREKRHGAKAGIINDFLAQMQEEYLAVFDADQNPMPNFLKKTLPYFETDPSLAFIQTPQFYTNVGVSPIARASCIQQTIFYEYICEAKNSTNSMFCCGTNVVFKKKMLKDVGGFDESSITEDFATSIRVHMRGYHSIYYPHVAAFGMAPESLPVYFKQQSRWATGSIQVFKKVVANIFMKPRSMTFLQWWEYLISSTYYFVGIAFFVLMISPLIYLFFNVPSYFSQSQVYLTVFVPYFMLSLLIFYAAMASRKYKLLDLYHGTILGILSFPILIKSAVFGLMGKKVQFVITTKGKIEKMTFLSLWPYHIMVVLCATAIIFGFMRLTREDDIYALTINIFWTFYHLFILCHIYYFNKAPELK